MIHVKVVGNKKLKIRTALCTYLRTYVCAQNVDVRRNILKKWLVDFWILSDLV